MPAPLRPWWRSPLIFWIVGLAVVVVVLGSFALASAGKAELAAARAEATEVGVLATVADITPARVADAENAAVVYRRVFAILTKAPSPSLAPTGTDVAADLTQALKDQDRDAATLALLEQGDRAEAWQELIRGSNLPHCDFGWDYRLGPNLLLPEASLWRNTVKLLVLRVQNLVVAGRVDEAVDLLAAGLRMRRHLDAAPLLIMHLVANGAEVSVLACLREELAAGTFGPEHLAVLRAAFTAQPARDGLLLCLRGETACMGGWCFGNPEKLSGVTGGSSVPGYGSWFAAPLRRYDEASYLRHMAYFGRLVKGERPPAPASPNWRTPLTGLLIPAMDQVIAKAEDQDLLRTTAQSALALAAGESPALMPALSRIIEADGTIVLTLSPPPGSKASGDVWKPWRILPP